MHCHLRNPDRLDEEAPVPEKGFLEREHCHAVAWDAGERAWRLEIHPVLSGDLAAVWLAVVNEDGEWAACERQHHHLTTPVKADWLDWLKAPWAENGEVFPASLDSLRSHVLDRFTDWLMRAGYDRDSAAHIARRVANDTGIPDECWPSWEHMTDSERHHTICVSLDLADPLL